MKTARDGAVYTREQIGHSALRWVLIALVTCGLGAIPAIYYMLSPRHYFHL